MYAYYIYTTKKVHNRRVKYNKPIKELQVKRDSEKVPEADSVPLIDLKIEHLIKIVNDFIV